MDAVLKLLAGAVAGGAFGALLSRARLCSGGRCNTKASLIFSIAAGAVFGAAAVWYFLHRATAN